MSDVCHLSNRYEWNRPSKPLVGIKASFEFKADLVSRNPLGDEVKNDVVGMSEVATEKSSGGSRQRLCAWARGTTGDRRAYSIHSRFLASAAPTADNIARRVIPLSPKF